MQEITIRMAITNEAPTLYRSDFRGTCPQKSHLEVKGASPLTTPLRGL